MNRKLRTFLIFSLAFIIAYFTIRQLLKYRLRQFIKEQEKIGIQVNHEGLHIEVLEGSAIFEKPDVLLSKSANIGFEGEMTLEELQINDIDYLKLLFVGNLNIESIALNKLQAQLKTSLVDSTLVQQDITSKKLGFAIKLKDFVLKDCKLAVRDGNNDSLLLSLQNFNLDVSDIEISDRTIANSIPFTGNDYRIASDSVFIKATPYENLHIAQLKGDHNDTSVSGITYRTILSKPDFDTDLTEEKDHYAITIDSIQFQNLGLKTGSEDKISFSAQKIALTGTHAAMYRNKLLPDNKSEKPMYSALLRNSPLAIQIDTFQIKEASYIYSEKSKLGNNGGQLEFGGLEVNMYNLGNTYKQNTTIHLSSLFMNNAPFEATWSFKAQDLKDTFTFKGELHELNLNELDRFTIPYANTSVDGTIHELYFNIYGNLDSSKMDLKSRYENVNVYLLKPGSRQRKKILSALANIFISNSSNTRNAEFRNVSTEVKRDKSKSPWNYIFENIEDGMKKLLL